MSHMKDLQIQHDSESHDAPLVCDICGESSDTKYCEDHKEMPQYSGFEEDAPTPREFCDCGHRIGDYGCPLCGE